MSTLVSSACLMNGVSSDVTQFTVTSGVAEIVPVVTLSTRDSGHTPFDCETTIDCDFPGATVLLVFFGSADAPPCAEVVLDRVEGVLLTDSDVQVRGVLLCLAADASF